MNKINIGILFRKLIRNIKVQNLVMSNKTYVRRPSFIEVLETQKTCTWADFLHCTNSQREWLLGDIGSKSIIPEHEIIDRKSYKDLYILDRRYWVVLSRIYGEKNVIVK